MRIRWIALLLLFVAPAALATNGYFMHGQGTLSKGMAGAGVAFPREALDLANNPAAAALLDGGYSVELSLFSPDRQYTIEGAPSGQPQTFGLTPGTISSDSKYFPMPALGYNRRLNDNSGFGVSAVAHGGMNTDYRTSTFYGASRTGVDLAQLFVNGTYGRRVTPNHALGISGIVVAQRFKTTGLEAFAGFSSDAAHLTGNGYDWSYGVGMQLGYLGRITENVSVGATWMPKISMSSFDEYKGLFAEGGGFDIPSALTAGVAVRATDTVTLVADYQRIQYSDVRSIGNPLLPNLMQQPLGMDGGAGFGWEDISVYKIGVDWQATSEWGFRAGYSKADQPIPDSEVLFNILAPGVVEQHYTFGVSRGNLNFGFMFAPSQSVIGANPLEMPGQQRIELEMSQWQMDFSYTAKF
ncbi:MAG: OmpP1/FadL family transporter [Thermoanaerobaculia bacterium]